MKITVISDIHGNITALLSVLEQIKGQEVDRIYCSGDMIGYYPFPNQVIKTLQENNIPFIKGNHEENFIKNTSNSELIQLSNNFLRDVMITNNINTIRNLDDCFELEIDNLKILIVHGNPWDHLTGKTYPKFNHYSNFKELEYDVIIMGHTHYPFFMKFYDKTIINAGSVGQPRDGHPGACYVIFDTETLRTDLYRVDYDPSFIIDVIKKLKFPGILAEYLHYGGNPDKYKK